MWHIIAVHPRAFGLALIALAALGAVWVARRPEWDKDD